jgi:hypothetical protein
LVLVFVIAMASTGCAAPVAAPPRSLTCHTQYRPDAETLTGSRELSMVVERGDGPTPQPERIEFDALALEVTFQGDAPEGRNVAIVISTAGGEPLVRDLYQYTDGTELTAAFAGGHGFTGLKYVYHEQSSLQVWCEAGSA